MTALSRYNANMEGEVEPDPIERLRFFLSLAITGQDWLDVEQFIDGVSNQLASRDEEVAELKKQNVMLCMYLSQIAWGNTAKQQSAWAEEALNKTKELSKLILCDKDPIAITKIGVGDHNRGLLDVDFFHIIPQKTLLYRAITDIRKVL